ncbi:hypothetical protein PUR_44750 [Paenibacillus sp. URB8-2]|nr:hypothetical protein PUR_44750 [Paenibacillus sp. URB8-2]
MVSISPFLFQEDFPNFIIDKIPQIWNDKYVHVFQTFCYEQICQAHSYTQGLNGSARDKNAVVGLHTAIRGLDTTG